MVDSSSEAEERAVEKERSWSRRSSCCQRREELRELRRATDQKLWS